MEQAALNLTIDENTTLELSGEKHAEALFQTIDKNREHL